MRLRILLPTEVLLDTDAHKVVVDAENGSHGLLPRHVDFVTALTAGILTYWDGEGEHFVAVNEGTLVKIGPEVLVSTRDAVVHHSLDALRSTVAIEFLQLDEHERLARTALARLEAVALERFLELEERLHG